MFFRLVICQTNKHVSAHIEHFEGRKVVSASTSEWAIKQHLRSNVDVVAMAAIGRILAHRCLECGLVEIHSEYDKQTSSSKVKVMNCLKRFQIFTNFISLSMS